MVEKGGMQSKAGIIIGMLSLSDNHTSVHEWGVVLDRRTDSSFIVTDGKAEYGWGGTHGVVDLIGEGSG